MGKNINLGKAIANLRRAKGLTQADLSTKSGISYSTLTKLERGAITAPSVFTVEEISKVLGVTVDEILNPVSQAPAADKMEEIKFVYCDVNGVLVRFFHKAFGTISQQVGINVDKIESYFWHYNEPANRGEISTEEFNALIEAKLGIAPGSFDWEKNYMQSVEPIMEMHKCLKEISKTTKIGLLSDNFPGFLNKMIEKGLLPDIEYAAIVESASVGAKKPDHQIYKIAEKMAKTPGKNIFFIDDSRTNLMEAEKHGWRVLWFDDYKPSESIRRVKQILSTS